MKAILSISIVLLASVLCQAQNKVQFDYDQNGNTVKRYMVIQEQDDNDDQGRKELKVDSTNGITVKVYPNPVLETEFNINVTGLEQDKTLNYTLVDLKGSILVSNSIQTGTKSVDVRTLPSGAYILLVNGTGFNKKWKLIK